MPRVEMIAFDSKELWNEIGIKVRNKDAVKYRRIRNITERSIDTIKDWFSKGTMPKKQYEKIMSWLNGDSDIRSNESYIVDTDAVIKTLESSEKLPVEEAIDKAIEESSKLGHYIYLDNIRGLSELASILNKTVEVLAYEAINEQISAWSSMTVSEFIKRRG